jgi:hypothetical protein
MMAGYANLQEIDDVVDEVPALLAPDVIFVGYSVANDWTGRPSLFFRVVLSDEASQPDRLLESGDRVESLLEARLQPYQRWGLYPYFDYRSQSEQIALRDPAWEYHGVSR